MKKLLLAAAISLAASTAYADSVHQNQSGVGNIQNNGGTVNSPGANSPVAHGGDGGNAFSNSISSSKANSTSVAAASGYSDSSAKASSNDSISIREEAQKRNPVSSAWSAPLVAAEDTCSGSSSVGGQAIGFGASFGSTWQDKDCVRRKDARELHNMGHKKAAIALMCQNDAVAEAMATAGTPCAVRLVPAAGMELVVASSNSDVVYEYPGRR